MPHRRAMAVAVRNFLGHGRSGVLDRRSTRWSFLRPRRHWIDGLGLRRLRLRYDFRHWPWIDVGSWIGHDTPPRSNGGAGQAVPLFLSRRSAAPEPANAAVDEQKTEEYHQHAQDLDGQDGFTQKRDAEHQRRDRGDKGGGGEIGG